MGPGRQGLPQGSHLCWLLCQAEALVQGEQLSVGMSDLPCWLVEEFVVAEEGAPCSNSQYVEKIMCSSSKRNLDRKALEKSWKQIKSL
ncbi:unnamed protein product [Nyctereutes procyonoides]|uniref:(raccoon dog) hypothetical protein n=1 Tax=Nyctereutes procyonoides TaxID=34880 RepID=A0A811Y896_NYCPR|nr:unnamed protein product [Nyctereutes procyonoides]